MEAVGEAPIRILLEAEAEFEIQMETEAEAFKKFGGNLDAEAGLILKTTNGSGSTFQIKRFRIPVH